MLAVHLFKQATQALTQANVSQLHCLLAGLPSLLPCTNAEPPSTGPQGVILSQGSLVTHGTNHSHCRTPQPSVSPLPFFLNLRSVFHAFKGLLTLCMGLANPGLLPSDPVAPSPPTRVPFPSLRAPHMAHVFAFFIPKSDLTSSREPSLTTFPPHSSFHHTLCCPQKRTSHLQAVSSLPVPPRDERRTSV